jgi:DNA-binding CsgD family transcriptional regulator
VLGRQFTADEITAVCEVDLHGVLHELEPALGAGILVAGAAAGEYRFTHALICETLYEEIDTLERLRLHGRAGDALVTLNTNRPESALGRIAHHYYESAALGNADKAVEYASRAAEAAVSVHAYEEAIGHYDQIIRVLQMNRAPETERLGEVFALKAYALLSLGHVELGTEAILRSANHIYKLRDVERLVQVATLLSLMTSCNSQQQQRTLVERLLAFLSGEDSGLRARALACHAFTMRSTGDTSQVDALTLSALEMAERDDDDVHLCWTLKLSILALRGRPETLERRIELGARHYDVARRMNDAHHLAEALNWHALDLIEAGRIDECTEALDRYYRVDYARFGLHKLFLMSYRITIALLRGEWDRLEEQIEALRDSGQKMRRDDAEGVFGAQMFALDRDQGRLAELRPLVQRFAASGERAWTPGLMLLCSELGMLAEARANFEELAADSFASVPQDDMRPTYLAFAAETCCRLHDAARAAELYQELLPYAGQTVGHPRAVCFGAAELYLGMLARTRGDLSAAERHLQDAAERHRAMGAWPWLARTLHQQGMLLLGIDRDEAASSGRRALREAEEIAGRLGMRGLLADLGKLLRSEQCEPQFPDGLTPREVEVLQLIALGRSNKDVSLVLSVSLNTVATHVRNILNKTHCANRTEAAAYAMRHGLQGGSRPTPS